MTVGTHGAVKAMTPDQVRTTGAEVMLANTYHLALRPGEGIVSKLGGLHAFMRWDGPILTDSGGFQVFSLPTAEIGDRGVLEFAVNEDLHVSTAPDVVLHLGIRWGW